MECHRVTVCRWVYQALILLGLVGMLICAVAEEPEPLPAGYLYPGADPAAAIARLCLATSDTGLFTGAVLVAQGGEVVYQGAFGAANREWGVANTNDTKYRLASVSKPFCALLVMQLVQEERLTLEDTISDHLLYYRQDTGSQITLHHLLAHQSGIRDFTANFDYRKQISRVPSDIDTFIQEHCSSDLIHPPGTIYSYCNAGYCILGRIIEKVTRKSFETNLHERIFDPAGMKDSGYERNRYIIDKLASGYTRDSFGYTRCQYIDMDTTPGAAGALYSTVGDMYLFDRALHTDQLLKKSWRDRMFTPNRDVPEVKAAGGRAHSRYGYGWQIYTRSHPVTRHRTKVINHGGAIHGFRAMYNRLVDDDALVVVLCNQGDALGELAVWKTVTNLSTELIHIVTDQPYRLPGRPRITQDRRLYDLTLNSGHAAAIEWYKEKGKPAAWGGTTMKLADHLLQEGRLEAGLAFMRMEAEGERPRVWVLRRAAVAHLENGEVEIAMKLAKQGLQMKPGDERLLMIQKEAESQVE